VTVSAVLYPRWPPLLKIAYVKLSLAVAPILFGVLKWRTQLWKRTTQESFQQSLVEIGSVASYKHNDELFNIYYGIFYELLSILTDYAI
jgi:hypothetical protein